MFPLNSLTFIKIKAKAEFDLEIPNNKFRG